MCHLLSILLVKFEFIIRFFPRRPATRISKKKKLKININRPVGTRVVFDEEGNTLPPLAKLADTKNVSGLLDQIEDKKTEYYKKLREDLKKVDKEDKDLDRQRRREKRMKDKMKQKRGNIEEEEDDDLSDSEGGEPSEDRPHKRSKIYFDSDDEGEREESKDKLGFKPDTVSLVEQEALALKLLSSMHS
ncbi:hypothetical protein CerSpe_036640 [Prunus speciosa]